MATEVISIPLLPGLRQDGDRAMLPQGSLVRANNVRVSRAGAISRRPPLVDAGTSVAEPGAAISGRPSGIFEYQGRQLLACGGRVYVRDSGATASTPWVESGRTGRALPVRTHWVLYDETAEPSNTKRNLDAGYGAMSVAVIGDLTAVSYARKDASSSEAEVHLVVLDRSGARRFHFTAAQRQNPRVIAVADRFLWLYQQDDGTATHADVYVRKLDPATLQFVGPVVENAFSVTGTTAGAGYDVVAAGGEVIFARVTTGPEIRVSRRSASDSQDVFANWPTLGEQDVPLASSIGVYPTAHADNDGIVVAWTRQGAANGVAVFDRPLTTTLRTTTMGASGGVPADPKAQIGICHRGPNSWWVLWTEELTAGTLSSLGVSGPVYATYGAILARDDIGSLLPAWSAPHFHLASRPYDGELTSFNVWLHSDSGIQGGLANPDDHDTGSYAWLLQRRYGLYAVVRSPNGSPEGSYSMAVEPDLLPDERAFGPGPRGWLPERASREAVNDQGDAVERHLLPVMVPVRTYPRFEQDSCAILLYEWETGSAAEERGIIDASGTALALGGVLQEVWSDRISDGVGVQPPVSSGPYMTDPHGAENGFCRAPAILGVTAVHQSGATLVALGEYQMCAVYEQIDPDGRRHRSAPSNVVLATAPDASSAFVLRVAVAPYSERFVSSGFRATVHVYLSQAGGSILYRCTPNGGAQITWNGVDQVIFVTVPWFAGTAADEQYIGEREIVYTQGGVVPNQPAPAHRDGVRGAGRVWLWGLFDQRSVECSKFEVPNEPVTFTRHPAFRTQLPDPCTGLAFMDRNVILFTATGIFTLDGFAAPNNQGAPALPPFPTPLPSSVGCTNWRSVVVTPLGVFFQSRGALYLLPRGLGEPEPVRGAEAELRGRRVISAAIVDDAGSLRPSEIDDPGAYEPGTADGQNLLVLSLLAPGSPADDNGRLLVYDLGRRVWVSSDDTSTPVELGASVGSWGGRLVVASRQMGEDGLRVESPDDWAGATAPSGEDPHPAARVSLSDVRPFGEVGSGRIRHAQILGEIRGDSRLFITAFYDGMYSKPDELDPIDVVGEPGDKFIEDIALGEQDLGSVSFDIRVEGIEGEDPNGGLVLHAISLEVEATGKRPRVGESRRAA